MTTHPDLRISYQYLRSVCRDFSERMVLGTAIRNGWSASALTDLAEGFRKGRYGMTIKPKEYAYQRTIHMAAERLYEAKKSPWQMQRTDTPEKEFTT